MLTTETNERIIITAEAAWLLTNNPDGSLNIRLIAIEPPYDTRLKGVVPKTQVGVEKEAIKR